MKKLTILFLLVFTCGLSHAQDPQLFDNQWFLMDLIVDGNVIEIPDNGEIGDVELYLLVETRIDTVACSGIGAVVSDFSNTAFTVETWTLLPGSCFLQTTIDFERNYFLDFFHADLAPGEIFTYILESGTNGALVLTITNDEGNTGVFGNPEALAISEEEKTNFVLYPNPTSEYIYLQAEKGVVVNKIKMYDVQGRLIWKDQKSGANINTIEIGTAHLNSGMYFIQLVGENGSTSVAQFVKE